MKREDFREITEKHIETARKIVELKGSCAGIKCEYCPFSHDSSTLNIYGCGDLILQEIMVLMILIKNCYNQQGNF